MTIVPAISAFHPVNALLLIAVAFSLARRAQAATPSVDGSAPCPTSES
jgi:hypothetical protein